jgi:hypothetical protein
MSMCSLMTAFVLQEQSTPLDEYVFSDDGMFTYNLLASYEKGDHLLLVFNMTSQQWMDGKARARCSLYI